MFKDEVIALINRLNSIKSDVQIIRDHVIASDKITDLCEYLSGIIEKHKNYFDIFFNDPQISGLASEGINLTRGITYSEFIGKQYSEIQKMIFKNINTYFICKNQSNFFFSKTNELYDLIYELQEEFEIFEESYIPDPPSQDSSGNIIPPQSALVVFWEKNKSFDEKILEFYNILNNCENLLKSLSSNISSWISLGEVTLNQVFLAQRVQSLSNIKLNDNETIYNIIKNNQTELSENIPNMVLSIGIIEKAKELIESNELVSYKNSTIDTKTIDFSISVTTPESSDTVTIDEKIKELVIIYNQVFEKSDLIYDELVNIFNLL